jgi:hypothetical protein
MSKQLVELFLGDPVDDPGERRVLSRLRADLEGRGVAARIFANFVAGRLQRQIDLLVVTKNRMAQIEVKTADPRFPIIGGVNGPWLKRLPDSPPEPLGRNYYAQARDATYAVADEMRSLAKAGKVPAPSNRQFYTDIDTVICISPGVPSGSELEPHKYVNVIGYDDLVDRLSEPGPRPPWSLDDLDVLARHLTLYPEPADSPEERDRQRNIELLSDYCRRYVDLHSAGLHELVPTSASIAGDTDASPVDKLISASAARGIVPLVGSSGIGKSHLAMHASIRLASQRVIPIWVRCRDYAPGRMRVAVARALASCATVRMDELASAAKDTGSPIVVILDGLNECPAGSRHELLEQLNSLRLWADAGAIITSTEAVPLSDAADVTHMTLQPLDGDERTALLRSYGAEQLVAGDAFASSLDLALVAQCASDLPPAASRADLFDAYVRRVCPAEATRAALRELAARMDDELKLALPTTEALGAVRRSETADPSLIDEVVASPLLAIGQGRVAFRHESFGRFLTAEQRVTEAEDVNSLAKRLKRSHSKDLVEYAVGLCADGDDRAKLLIALADAEMLAKAARGEFGPATAHLTRQRIVRTILDEASAVSHASLEINETESYFSVWRQSSPRSEQDQACLSAAALCLPNNLFIAEAAALLDVTDERCAREMRQLQEAGNTSAISTIVSATYSGLTHAGSAALLELGASVIFRTGEIARVQRYQSDYGTDATATRMLTCTALTPRWGRLLCALQLVNHDADADLRALPELLADAWRAQGYHLRLHALQTVAGLAGLLEGDARARILEILRGLDASSHIFLSSALIEALSAYGDIEAISSLEDIKHAINAILATPDDPEACQAAHHVVCSQFEDESIVGPYCEAIEDLPDHDQLQLLVMAMQSGEAPYQAGWIVQRIAQLALPSDAAAVEILRRQVAFVDTENPMPQEPVEAHDAALAWFAVHDLDMPALGPTEGDLSRHAWQALDRLALAAMRSRPYPEEEVRRQWNELLTLCPMETAVVFYFLSMGTWTRSSQGAFTVLVRSYPEEVRQLQQWLLGRISSDGVVAAPRVRTEDLRRLALTLLGKVGNGDTAALLRQLPTESAWEWQVVDAVHSIERRLLGQ